ncbi:site-specific integrase [Dysgonomonas sp. BGC7]|uniref:site-specific integrase n=1 Tax=Dysgonomonas sp. BGC7 TaxID=1658008 RepID=UPI003221E27C
MQPVERDFLTEEEVLKIKNKKIIVERLGIVRDAFVLACFTGLSDIDIKQLRKQNIITGVDGEQWIYANREKTNIISKIPLLPEADKIIKKYSSYFHLRETGYIIPVPSNQKVNAYLKEIADLAEITKNLTFRFARHSFATLALNYGMSIESVSKMLGHNQIRTTQIYAKVTEEKIAKEMAAFKNRKKKA